MNKQTLSYFFLRCITYPFALLPYRWIHLCGKIIGRFSYYILSNYRKRALSNLALAKDLHLSNKELISIAKLSFENLAINMLEYPKFYHEKNFAKIIQCENPQIAEAIYKQDKGIIFFCGHQSNWEVLFLDGTKRMRGTAIGKPIKNHKLYQWVVSIREKNGGKMIIPKNAMKEGLRCLKKGIFLGIVGDQGMPNSGYCFPFLGRKAWTSPAPALLAYKTNSPIIVAMTRREKGKYKILYSDPIWPDFANPIEHEVPKMMNKALSILQDSIKENPGQWLWQHNRWKQQTPQTLFKEFRKDCISIMLPQQENEFYSIYPHLINLKRIYNKDFIILFVPEKFRHLPFFETDETIYYQSEKELLLKDYRFKIIFNFTSNKKVKKHYLKLSAFNVLTLEDLYRRTENLLEEKEKKNLSLIFKAALCRPNSTITDFNEDVHA
jgi:KDO2-lipid IV(A) lauroyltransferase